MAPVASLARKVWPIPVAAARKACGDGMLPVRVVLVESRMLLSLEEVAMVAGADLRLGLSYFPLREDQVRLLTSSG